MAAPRQVWAGRSSRHTSAHGAGPRTGPRCCGAESEGERTGDPDGSLSTIGYMCWGGRSFLCVIVILVSCVGLGCSGTRD